VIFGTTVQIKKCSEETQTLCAGGAKNFHPAADPFTEGWPKFNQLEMVTTFNYRPSLVRTDDFELSW